MPQAAESPRRTWLKASDVCDRAQVQPYVLRTWEMEFPDLGVARTPGGPRLYRPTDLDRVLRIKQLVFGEGLTLAGARRKLEEERQPSDELPFDDVPAPAGLAPEARQRLEAVRSGLRELLGMLSAPLPQRTAKAAEAEPVEASASGAPRRTSKRRRSS
ncbi:MAG TPA: MerR family transcriptional regulator [Vicinamibacterales bacterium]